MKGRSNRIYALILQELFVTRHTLEVFVDIFFMPLMNVILFGLITHFISSVGKSTSSDYLLLGILLWQVISINQYSVTLSALWNVWSHNLTNMFITPISVAEYIAADVISALIKSITIFILLSVGVFVIFHFNITHIGIANLVIDFVNLSIFGWSLGVMLLGLIFRYGTRVQAVAWGLVYLFQPITASFFPLSVLPHFMRIFSLALPPTQVFQSARQSLSTGGIAWHSALGTFALNIVFGAIAVLVFKRLFYMSKVTGQFARNDL